MGGDALLLGFTTSTGTVTAARDWGRPRSGAACARRSREAGRRCFTILASSASCSSRRGGRELQRQRAGGRRAARCATRAGDRRDLPSRDQAPEPLNRTPASTATAPTGVRASCRRVSGGAVTVRVCGGVSAPQASPPQGGSGAIRRSSSLAVSDRPVGAGSWRVRCRRARPAGGQDAAPSATSPRPRTSR
jgi:hypothetical protein